MTCITWIHNELALVENVKLGNVLEVKIKEKEKHIHTQKNPICFDLTLDCHCNVHLYSVFYRYCALGNIHLNYTQLYTVNSSHSE